MYDYVLYTQLMVNKLSIQLMSMAYDYLFEYFQPARSTYTN